TLCIEHGLEHVLVNLGGDVRAAGPQQDGAPWRIGIRHPRRAGEVIATVELAGGALATSGDYERFFEIDGCRYCHLLNAHTGWPVRYWQPACPSTAKLYWPHLLRTLQRQCPQCRSRTSLRSIQNVACWHAAEHCGASADRFIAGSDLAASFAQFCFVHYR